MRTGYVLLKKELVRWVSQIVYVPRSRSGRRLVPYLLHRGVVLEALVPTINVTPFWNGSTVGAVVAPATLFVGENGSVNLLRMKCLTCRELFTRGWDSFRSHDNQLNPRRLHVPKIPACTASFRIPTSFAPASLPYFLFLLLSFSLLTALPINK